MNADDIKAAMNEIFRDVLDNDSIELTRETTAEDIDEWDSLAHIGLIVAIEKHFKLKFSMMDVKPLKNVGEFIDLIQRKQAA
jgi:acyl carrier protein